MVNEWLCIVNIGIHIEWFHLWRGWQYDGEARECRKWDLVLFRTLHKSNATSFEIYAVATDGVPLCMMTSSNGNIFRVTGHLCGEFTGHRSRSPVQRPVTRSFDVFVDVRLNKRLNKQSWCWWFETPSRPLWRHCNDDQMSGLLQAPK